MSNWHAVVTWDESEQRVAAGVTRHGLADQIVLPTEQVPGPRGPRRAALVPGYVFLGSEAEPDWPALQRTPGVLGPLASGAGPPARLDDADIGRLHVMEMLVAAQKREQQVAAHREDRARRRRPRPRRSKGGRHG